MTLWVPGIEEMERRAKSTDAEVPFVQPVIVAEQNGSCMDAVDIEPFNYHCSTGVMVGGGAARGRCVVQRVMDSGSGISIIGGASLCRLQHHFPELPTMYPYVGGPSMRSGAKYISRWVY